MFGFMVELVRWNRYKGMILRANKPDDVHIFITNTKLKIWKELGIESNLDDQSCFGSGLHDERMDRLDWQLHGEGRPVLRTCSVCALAGRISRLWSLILQITIPKLRLSSIDRALHKILLLSLFFFDNCEDKFLSKRKISPDKITFAWVLFHASFFLADHTWR